MEESLVLSMKTTRAEAVRILADGLCVDVETVTTALKRAKKHGFVCRDWPVTHLIGELPLRLREFIQSLTRTNS